ncbi:hypothetical protein [Kiloniella sp. b19]|uniref:hypothetical protein n=1 Tax=Kiloniella sp. GXU_MW_B19 TaxID=3141326 RepID=UPI0031DCFB05
MIKAYEDPKERVTEELREGETLIWAARPHPEKRIQRAKQKAHVGLYMLCGAAIWIATTLVATFSDYNPEIIILAPLGLPFLLVGYYLLSEPEKAAFKARRTIYAITNQRLIIIKDRLHPKILSFDREDCNTLERFDLDNGCSDVVFQARDLMTNAPAQRLEHSEHSNRQVTKRRRVGFFEVENGAEVQEMIAHFMGHDRETA